MGNRNIGVIGEDMARVIAIEAGGLGQYSKSTPHNSVLPDMPSICPVPDQFDACLSVARVMFRLASVGALLHHAGKTEPCGQRDLPDLCFFNIAQINRDYSKAAILNKNIRCLECLLDRLETTGSGRLARFCFGPR